MKPVHALVLVFAAFIVFDAAVLADGVSYYRERDASSFAALQQIEQRAVIVHRDGVERLLIAVNVDLSDEAHGLWIFPVPGTADKVRVDLVDTFPILQGRNPINESKNRLGDMMFAVRFTQIYPVIWGGFMATLGGEREYVEVHQSVERWGLTAEAVTAPTIDALAAHLSETGAAIEPADLQPFARYLSGGYVLVVARLSSREEFRREFPERRAMGRVTARKPCLYVRFPTERAFYPMRPTAYYGHAWVPATLAVLGCVRAEGESSTPKWVRQSYFWLEEAPQGGPPGFLEGVASGMPYTLVRAEAEAAAYTEDLWFVAADEPGTHYARAIALTSDLRVAVPAWLVLTGLTSYLAAGLSGLIMFRRWRPYARLGLWNLLTLIGFHHGVERAKRSPHPLPVTRWEGFWQVDIRLCFTLAFLAVSVLLQALLSWPLGS